MKKHIVIVDIFRDLETNHVYHRGEDFPFDDSVVSEERIKELSTTENKMHRYLIRQKTFDEYDFETLKNLTEKEKIEVNDEDNVETLANKLTKNEKAKKSIMKKLNEKEIAYTEDMSFEDLKSLLKNE